MSFFNEICDDYNKKKKYLFHLNRLKENSLPKQRKIRVMHKMQEQHRLSGKLNHFCEKQEQQTQKEKLRNVKYCEVNNYFSSRFNFAPSQNCNRQI